MPKRDWLAVFEDQLNTIKEGGPMHESMGRLFESCGQSGKGESEPWSAFWMGTEVRFRCQEFAESFNGLSDEAKSRVAAYVASRGNVAESIRRIGLTGSVKTFNMRLAEIAKASGAKSIRDLLLYDWLKRRAAGDAKDVMTAASLHTKLKQQEYRCAISGVKLTPKTATLDHKVPVAKGGENTNENLQWLHRDVNRAKADMSQESFVKMCQRVAAWNR